MMTEREQQIADLLEDGLSREEVQAECLDDEVQAECLDDDLWILPPGRRWPATGKEWVVSDYEEAVRQLEVFEQAAAHGGLFANVCVDTLLLDTVARARELLRRSRERLREVQEEEPGGGATA
jgi:hypothetical protein